jgi:hypothetical protein
MPLDDALIAVRGVLSIDFKKKSKILKIRGVFHYTSTTSRNMEKWRTPTDLPGQIGVSVPLNDALIVVEGTLSGVEKQSIISKIGGGFHYTSTTSGGMVIWRAPGDSRPQIGVITPLNDVLIVVGGASSVDLKSRKFRKPDLFPLYLNNWGDMAERRALLYSSCCSINCVSKYSGISSNTPNISKT